MEDEKPQEVLGYFKRTTNGAVFESYGMFLAHGYIRGVLLFNMELLSGPVIDGELDAAGSGGLR